VRRWSGTEVGRGRDLHGSTLSMRHAIHSTCDPTRNELNTSSRTRRAISRRRTQQLSDHTLDRSTTEDGERVASVGSDDLVVLLDGIVHPDRDGFLFAR
jgi:hypothetical protein